MQILFGDGMGGFNLANELAVGAGPLALATGDVNHDGTMDAAVWLNSRSGEGNP